MTRLLTTLALIGIGAMVAVLGLRFLFPLPAIADRPVVEAIPVDSATTLGEMMLTSARQHPDKNGVLPLGDGVDALRSRLDLADMAEASIDVQYYIWHADVSGYLLLDALRRAAERGVRLRLLLDDNGVPGLDATMAALNELPNVEIRLFNPSTVRSPKMAGYAFDFMRMNRRMHNKSFIVDGAAAVIGGRNIGDEYFQIGAGNYYLDLDVLTVGPIVPATAAAFDEYWNSGSVFAVESIIAPEIADLPAFERGVAEARQSPAGQVFLTDEFDVGSRLNAASDQLEWTNVQLVFDDPVKGEGIASRDQLMITRLGAILGTIKQGVDLVSAYFVPGTVGTQWFSDVVTTGAQVRILTNALRTTDVLMVHAGYAKYRRKLLEAGVTLFELKPTQGAPQGREELNALGLSGASLHAKTFAVDNERIFIGSFNFDPRSALLNCEMGFLIDSPALARRVSSAFDTVLPVAAWRPELVDGDLVWVSADESGDETTLDQEPGATRVDTLALTVLGWLPIEWLL